jgi:hypothetical protein
MSSRTIVESLKNVFESWSNSLSTIGEIISSFEDVQLPKSFVKAVITSISNSNFLANIMSLFLVAFSSNPDVADPAAG